MNVEEDNKSRMDSNIEEYEKDYSKYELDKEILERKKKEYRTKYNNALKNLKKQKRKNVLARIRGILGIIIIMCIYLSISKFGIMSIMVMFSPVTEEDIMTTEIQKQMDEKQLLAVQLKDKERQLLEVVENDNMPFDTVIGKENREELNEYVHSLKRYSDKEIEKMENSNRSFYHIMNKINLEKYMITDSNIDTIYPGAIIKGDSLFRNAKEYTVIPVDRTPMVLTSNQSKTDSVKINNVNYEEVMKGLSMLVDKSEEEQGHAKEWNYQIITYSSSDELEMSLGINVDSVDLSSGYNSNSNTSYAVIAYTQLYYTVSANPLKDSISYFANGTDLKCLGEYEPSYVSSVGYGRAIFVVVKGEMTEKELGAQISADIKGVGIDAGLKRILTDETLSKEIHQYGGSEKNVNEIFGVSESKEGIKEKWNTFWNGSEKDSLESKINSFINTEDSSLANPVPIFYQLKYISDNSVVPTMFIRNEKHILVENAKKVVFSIDGKEKGNVRFDIPDSVGCLLTDDVVSVGKDIEGKEVILIWDSSVTEPIRYVFNEKEPTLLELQSLKIGETNVIEMHPKEFLSSGNKLNVYISNTVQ